MSDGGPLAHQRELLRSVVAGRRFVVVTDVLPASVIGAQQLRDHGADDVLIVATSRGTGEVAPEVEAGAVVLDVHGRGIMGGIRAFERVLAEPPAELVAAVDRFDPERRAEVLGAVFVTSRTVLGRRVFGARTPTWCALEDKTTVDGLWDAAGIERGPSQVVPIGSDDLGRAARRLDAGDGVVLVADNRTGWHGGGYGLRWARSDTELSAARDELATMADRVRMMPFLEGLPCSIHGWVVGREVVTFRPCEMVVLRESGAARLRYAGASATWLPRDDDREAMREVARRVGVHLRDAYDYRGVFTVDGVLTVSGFRPTELNPRFGIGLATLGRRAGLPLYLLHCATVTHPELDWRAHDLETEVLAASLEAPGGGGSLVVEQAVTGRQELPIRRTATGVEPVDAEGVGDTDGIDGSLEVGPSPGGGLLRAAFSSLPPGPPAAPLVAAAFALGTQRFGLDLPTFVAAPDLRPRG
jgi:hypothetical protein